MIKKNNKRKCLMLKLYQTYIYLSYTWRCSESRYFSYIRFTINSDSSFVVRPVKEGYRKFLKTSSIVATAHLYRRVGSHAKAWFIANCTVTGNAFTTTIRVVRSIRQGYSTLSDWYVINRYTTGIPRWCYGKRSYNRTVVSHFP